MILVINNPADGRIRNIDLGSDPGEWLIGRQDDCQVVLDSRKVSRKHARLFGSGSAWFISDLGSTGGSRLNGEAVSADPVPFSPGDSLEIGDYVLTLSETEVSAVPAAAQKRESAPQECAAAQPAVQSVAKPPAKPEPPSDFQEANLLYTQELMALKKKIHEHVLTKMNLTEQSIQAMAKDEMLTEQEEALDQTLKDLRHELPREIPLDMLRQSLMDELVGFGPISPLLRADDVDEIMVNGPNLICVERRGRIQRTGAKFYSNRHLLSIIQRIVEPLGRHVDDASPMVDARLPDGSRVNAVIPPLALDGPSVTIVKSNFEEFVEKVRAGEVPESRFIDATAQPVAAAPTVIRGIGVIPVARQPIRSAPAPTAAPINGPKKIPAMSMGRVSALILITLNISTLRDFPTTLTAMSSAASTSTFVLPKSLISDFNAAPLLFVVIKKSSFSSLIRQEKKA